MQYINRQKNSEFFKTFFRLVPGSLYFLALCILIQQIPYLFGVFTQIDQASFKSFPTGVKANVSSLPSGRYYLSLGTVLDETEVWLDGKLIKRGRVIIGTPLDIDGHPMEYI